MYNNSCFNDIYSPAELIDADVLTYQIIGEKIPAARFVFVFVLNGEKPLLNDFRVMLPKPQQEAPAAK